MKTLSKLIQESLGRLEEEIIARYGLVGSAKPLKELLKTELETIVKESFKNTRVEEREIPDTKIEELTETGKINRSYKVGFNEATQQQHNKECEFLGN